MSEQEHLYSEVDSAQQYSELIGLSAYLRDAVRRGALPLASESAITKALSPTSFDRHSIKTSLHRNEAGRRLLRQIKKGFPLSRADAAQINAMQTFPEQNASDHAARRLAFLMALETLSLATPEQKKEFASLSEWPTAANI